MIYGLWLSASGVMANSYRQDVIANNLANAETAGFRRDIPLFQQRLTEAQQRGVITQGGPENLGLMTGGLLASNTRMDQTQGQMEQSANPLDLAIVGEGYFQVDDHGHTRLTRNGQMMVDRQGYLIMANESGQRFLDRAGNPIQLQGPARPSVGGDGTVMQNGVPVAQLAVKNVPQPQLLTKSGATLLDYPEMEKLTLSDGLVRSECVEGSNVDPATELAQLMDAQRQLEANANMIRYQDQMLAKLVNEVGKIT